MATEILLDAVRKYVEPLLNFGWININPQGFLVEREHGNALKFRNDNYMGMPGEVAYTFPVIPMTDEHYLQIRDNPEQEIFNPFLSVKHMTLVVMEFKRSLVNIHVSDKASEGKELSDLEDLIMFYYNGLPDGRVGVGFCNAEDEEHKIDLYTYADKEVIAAMWGLCVTAFNDIDRKHDNLFYTIEKSWKKAKKLADEWDKARRGIVPAIRDEHKADYGFKGLDLVGADVNYRIPEYSHSNNITKNEMQSYLLSLFSPEEIAAATVSPLANQTNNTAFEDTKPTAKTKRLAHDALMESAVLLEHHETVPQNPPLSEESPEPARSSRSRSRSSFSAPVSPSYPGGMSYGGMTRQVPQNVPENIDQIDFMAHERPNPFAYYQTGRYPG
jgi:hypothetical protein